MTDEQKPAEALPGSENSAENPAPDDNTGLEGYGYLFTRANLLIGGGALFSLLLLTIFLVYNIGLSRGRLAGTESAGTEDVTATPILLLADATATQVIPSATPTQPPATATPLPPTPLPPTATPDNAALAHASADRFVSQAAAALSLLAVDVRPAAAETILRVLAQGEGMENQGFPLTQIPADRWAVTTSMRIGDDRTIPILFWEERPGSENVRGERLDALLAQADEMAWSVGQATLTSGADGALLGLFVTEDAASGTARENLLRFTPDGGWQQIWQGDRGQEWPAEAAEYTALFIQETDGSYRPRSESDPVAIASTGLDVPVAETATPLPSDTPTATETATATATETPTETATATATPSTTATDTATATPISTPTETPLPTDTPTPTATASALPTETPTETAAATPTETPLPTETPTETATATETATETPLPTATPTAIPTDTPTPLPTATPTETATDRPTATPLPTATPTVAVPKPPAGPPVIGTIVLFPARMRAGPTTSSEIVARLVGGVRVVLLGITEEGNWAFVQVDAPQTAEDGLLGWMALELMAVDGELGSLPLYDSQGNLLAPTPTATAEVLTPPQREPTATPRPPSIPTPTATLSLGPSRPIFGTLVPADAPTATETATTGATRVQPTATAPAPVTPIQPGPERGAGIAIVSSAAPGPANGSLVLTVGGKNVPANPLLPVPVQSSDGRAFQLLLDITREGQVEIWSGLIGEAQGRWLPARGELLWPGVRLYVQGGLVAGTADIRAESVRIAGLPAQARMVTGAVAEIGQAQASGSGVALVGSRDETSIYLLESSGKLTSIGANGQRAIPVLGEAGGLIVPAPNAPAGINSFTLLQDSGDLMEILAQPLYNIRGIVADGAGSILWIETPQVGLSQWQLWEYRLAENQVHLLAQENLEVFGGKDDPLLPSLAGVVAGETGGWWYLLETAKPQNQQTNAGFFQVNLTPDGRADEVRRLMAEGSYRAPLYVSPNGRRLAYLAYDPNQPSLTAGFVQPSNRLWVRPVGDGAFGNDQPLAAYQTENRFEFLTPSLAWRDDQRIVLTRSRFSPVGVFALDTFGVTEVNIAGDTPQSASHLLRIGSVIKDSAICRDDGRILLSVVDESGVYRLAEWTGEGKPIPLADLPVRLDRIFACWRLPDGAFTVTAP